MWIRKQSATRRGWVLGYGAEGTPPYGGRWTIRPKKGSERVAILSKGTAVDHIAGILRHFVLVSYLYPDKSPLLALFAVDLPPRPGQPLHRGLEWRPTQSFTLERSGWRLGDGPVLYGLADEGVVELAFGAATDEGLFLYRMAAMATTDYPPGVDRAALGFPAWCEGLTRAPTLYLRSRRRVSRGDLWGEGAPSLMAMDATSVAAAQGADDAPEAAMFGDGATTRGLVVRAGHWEAAASSGDGLEHVQPVILGGESLWVGVWGRALFFFEPFGGMKAVVGLATNHGSIEGLVRYSTGAAEQWVVRYADGYLEVRGMDRPRVVLATLAHSTPCNGAEATVAREGEGSILKVCQRQDGRVRWFGWDGCIFHECDASGMGVGVSGAADVERDGRQQVMRTMGEALQRLREQHHHSRRWVARQRQLFVEGVAFARRVGGFVVDPVAGGARRPPTGREEMRLPGTGGGAAGEEGPWVVTSAVQLWQAPEGVVMEVTLRADVDWPISTGLTIEGLFVHGPPLTTVEGCGYRQGVPLVLRGGQAVVLTAVVDVKTVEAAAGPMGVWVQTAEGMVALPPVEMMASGPLAAARAQQRMHGWPRLRWPLVGVGEEAVVGWMMSQPKAEAVGPEGAASPLVRLASECVVQVHGVDDGVVVLELFYAPTRAQAAAVWKQRLDALVPENKRQQYV